MNSNCPCGSGDRYSSCCGRFLEGGEWPASAEQLMRSRYSAYVRARADYLLATWHPGTRPQTIDPGSGSVTWLQLKVIRADNNAVSGVVEFVARYKVNGKAYRLHEVSQFVKENGLWLYVNGEMQP